MAASRLPIPHALALLLVGLALSGALVWSAVDHIGKVDRGSEILLETEGFDPRSLLRGHYSQVRYRISAVSDLAGDISTFGRYEPVWVIIQPDGADWAVTAVLREKPADVPAGGHLIQAEGQGELTSTVAPVVTDTPNGPSPPEDTPGVGGYMSLRYGIERVYAQQSEAEALDRVLLGSGTEDGAPAPDVKMVVSVGEDHRLRLKGIVIGSERSDFTWW